MNDQRSLWKLCRLFMVAIFITGVSVLPIHQPVYAEGLSNPKIIADQQGSTPVLTASGASPTFVENTAGVAVDDAIELTGPTISGATVSITGGFISAQDRLEYSMINGISGSYNTSTGILTLSGTGTAEAYQGALRAVMYRNISDTPNTTDRTISIAVGEILYNPDNQHFYEFISHNGIYWSTARDEAAVSSLYGLQGYLATITSSSENAFVTSKLQGVGWIGASDATVENEWRWVTGPEAGQQFWQGAAAGHTVNGMYANWNGGEPNDSGGNEDYGHMIFNTNIGPKGSWNDLGNAGGSGDYAPQGYLVEYGGMAGDPTISLTANVTMHVQTANDAPVLNSTFSPSFTTILEDATNPTGNTVAQIVVDGSITDPDSSVVEAIAVVAVESSLGTWQYSINGGSTWVDFGEVSSSAARLLDSTAWIRLLPAANANGTAAGITFRAWDPAGGTSGAAADVTVNGGSTAFSSATDTASISITAVNDPPTFDVGPDQVVNEDCGQQIVNYWASNISTGPANESYQTIGTVASPSNWPLFDWIPQVDQYNGTLRYTPAANANGQATITLSYFDNGGNLNGGSNQTTKTFKITVLPVNDAPTGDADSYSVDEDTPLVVSAPGVLGNDADIDGDSLTAILTSSPLHGSLALSADGSFTYSPDANYSGPDSFTYQASDGTVATASITVSITVNPINDSPVAVDDTATALEDTAHVLSVLLNDSDVDGDALTVCAMTDGEHGQTNPDGDFPETRIQYTPGPNFNGNDTFTYGVCDGNGGSDSGTVTVTVTPINDEPSFTIGADQTVSEDGGAQSVSGWATNLSKGPADESGQSLTFAVVAATPGLFSTQPAVNPSTGTLAFTPAENAHGSTTVSISLSDNGGTANGGDDTSASQSFTITINPVNDAPVGTPDTYTVAEDGTLTAPASGVLNNDIDVDGDSLTAINASTPQHGSLTLNADGSFTYIPETNYFGTDSFTYQVSDGTVTSTSTSVSITVTNVNDAPVGVDDTIVTNEDTAQTVDILVNDIDVDGDELSICVSSGATNGSVVINPDQTVTYTPNLNFNGSDQLTYGMCDGNGGVHAAQAQITVTAVNDAPSFTPGVDQTLSEDAGAQTISGWATGIQAGPANEAGQALTFHLTVDRPELFAVQPAIDAVTGNLTFTPADDANGIAKVTISLSDDGGTALGGVDVSVETTLTITLTAAADAPVLGLIQKTGTEDEDLAFSATDFNSAFSDVDGDTLASIEIRSLPEHGVLKSNSLSVALNQVILVADLGGLHFTPDPDWNGTTEFAWNGSDGTAFAVSEGRVEMTIEPGADAPVAGLVQVTGPEDEPVAFRTQDFVDGYADIDGDALAQVRVASLPGHGQLNLAGQAVTAGQEILLNDLDHLTFTPEADWNGTTTFAWSGSDGTAYASQDGEVKISVIPVNDAPVLIPDQIFELPTVRYSDTNPAGTSIETIVAGLSGADADGSLVAGLAISGSAGNGTWQYSSDAGSHWTSLGQLSETEARLLDGAALIRLIPNTDVEATAGLVFRLWDQSTGQSGETADTTVNGGTEAFSTVSGKISVQISGPTLYEIEGGEADEDVLYGNWTLNLPGGTVPAGSEMYVDTIQTSLPETGAVNIGQTIQVKLFGEDDQPISRVNQPVEVCYRYSEAELREAGGDAAKLRIAINYPNENEAWTAATSWIPQGTQMICTSTYRFPILLRLFIPTLPVTGFAPVEVTVLPEQPSQKAYQGYSDLSLEIPSLYAEMPIVSVPLTADGWDLTWLSDQAGYLRGTTFPTWEGNTGLTGHIYLADGTRGPFWGLSLLERGDEILIHAWGQTYTYEVRKISLVDPQDLSVLDTPEDGTWLTLLTCQEYEEDSHAYTWRLAVQAELVGVY